MAPQTGPSEKGTGSVPAFPQLFTWEEIGIRNGRGQGREQWLVIDRKVYDVSEFSKRHPGGRRVISHYAGQDATVRAGEEGGSRGREGGRGGKPCLVVVIADLGLQDARKSPTNISKHRSSRDSCKNLLSKIIWCCWQE